MKKFLITLIILLFNPFILNAQSTIGSTSVSVSPAIIEIPVGGEYVVKKEVRVFNLSSEAIPMKAFKESFSIENKEDLTKEQLSKYDASSWIHIKPDDTDFILQPNESKTIELEIIQPEGASPGGHYATIYFVPLNPVGQSEGTSALIQTRVGVLVLMKTEGDIVENLKVKEFITPSIIDNSNISLNLKLLNDGNVHVLPVGKINIYDDLRNTLVNSINIDPSLSLPGIERIIQIETNHNFAFGKLSAEVEISYGQDKVLKSEKLSILIIPYKHLIVLVLISIFVIIDRKRFKKAAGILFAHGSKVKHHVKKRVPITRVPGSKYKVMRKIKPLEIAAKELIEKDSSTKAD